ncbi:MAG TPA: hypothetical protein VF070_28905 [Streptosporangiaceae bacterium]
MRAWRSTALTATALIAAAAFTAGMTVTASAATQPGTPQAPLSFAAYETGYGPTEQAAEQAADFQMAGDYYGCSGSSLVSDGQEADGTWWAEVTADCTGWR